MTICSYLQFSNNDCLYNQKCTALYPTVKCYVYTEATMSCLTLNIAYELPMSIYINPLQYFCFVFMVGSILNIGQQIFAELFHYPPLSSSLPNSFCGCPFFKKLGHLRYKHQKKHTN